MDISKNESIAQNPLAKFIRNELPNHFKEEIPNSGNYYIKGSSGMGSWAVIPWIGFLNKNISSTFKEGYYVAYLFKEDMSGFYLTLMFGVGNFRDYSTEDLYKVSDELRKFIQTSPQVKIHSSMKLRERNSNSYIASRYEKAAIYSIEYQLSDLPSEKELKADLRNLLDFYDFVYENNCIEKLLQKNIEDLKKYDGGMSPSDSTSNDNVQGISGIENQINHDRLEHEETDQRIKEDKIEKRVKNKVNSKSEHVSSHFKDNGENNLENDVQDNRFNGDGATSNKIQIFEIESKPNKYYNFKKHSHKFKQLSKLFSDKNIEKLDDLYYLEENEFDNIIENIIIVHNKVLSKLIDKNSVDFERLSILDKMFLFSKSFVKTHYKCGGDDLGYYRFNEIYVEEREPTDYKKIRTIIHELSHFLLSEILEQVLSEILDTDKTDILEAFIFYTLTHVNDFYLIDEYCACTVEGRFVSLGHQDYTSFKNSLNKEHKFSDEDLSIFGNTFARYIMLIMESFLNENLIKEIRKEGSKIDYPNNDITFETDEYLEWDDFKDAIGLILEHKTNYSIEEAEIIFEYSSEFKKNNK